MASTNIEQTFEFSIRPQLDTMASVHSQQIFQCDFWPYGSPDMKNAISDTKAVIDVLAGHLPSNAQYSEPFCGLKLILVPAQNGNCLVMLQTTSIKEQRHHFRFIASAIQSNVAYEYGDNRRKSKPHKLLPHQACCIVKKSSWADGLRITIALATDPNSALLSAATEELLKSAGKTGLRIVRDTSTAIKENMSGRSSNDTVFLFPSPDGARYIWANSKILAQRSDYFRDMFAFEGDEKRSTDRSSRAISAATGDQQSGGEYSPSKSKELSLAHTQQRNSMNEIDQAEHVVTITAHDHVTYRSLLGHLLTSEPIYYAPLESLGVEGDSGLDEERSCPKAVYRLAHELRMDELQQHALANLTNQITAKNAEEELFSDLCADYSEIRRAIWARWQWSEKKGSPQPTSTAT